MTALVWDQAGDKFYQTGVDRGVLGLLDGTVVAWNGLTGVEDGTNSEVKSYYLDGVKFLEHVTPGEFVGKLSAFTYPDEFEKVLGIDEIANGLFVHEQPPECFNLSYRSLIGNDLDPDYGYRIHLLYNLSANPDSFTYETIQNPAVPGEFSWGLSGVPATVYQKRSTVQISVDSKKADPAVLQLLEDSLYGTETTDPHFPSILEVRQFFGELGGLVIVEHGDGTWTALDSSDDFITIEPGDSTQFTISNANAVYLDETTYQIQDTPIPIEEPG